MLVQMGSDLPEVKLFGKWSLTDVQVTDMSLQDVITVNKNQKYLPHSAGRYQVKRFRKVQCPVAERLVCSVEQRSCSRLCSRLISSSVFSSFSRIGFSPFSSYSNVSCEDKHSTVTFCHRYCVISR